MSPVPALERALLALRSRSGAVVLVDGRSGSGKSTFASALAAGSGARLLRLDDVYPGWDGLAAAARSLVDDVLLPRVAGSPGTVRTWDWRAGRPGPVRHVPPGGGLVVEGCGALSRRAAGIADLGVWVDLAEPVRRARALERDGGTFAPHWERWAQQELAFAAREDPCRLATVEVDGRRFPQPLFSGPTEDAH
jgi:hypothetical protein